MRRLTADVIRNVLAEPCRLSRSEPDFAEQLIHKLSNERSLVYTAEDGSLRHDPELRRRMLKDLTTDVPASMTRSIHDAAVAFYQAHTANPVSRAEEIYHRLMRGDDAVSLQPLWLDGVGSYLRGAIDEVSPSAQLWLSSNLGVTPNEGLLELAALEDWENLTARSVQRLISYGNFESALQLLRQRLDRTGASPLYLLESEAYRLMGNNDAAAESIELGLASAAGIGDLAAQRDLLIQKSLIEETTGRLEDALESTDTALGMSAGLLEQVDLLRLVVTKIRLLRKLGPFRNNDRSVAIDSASKLLDKETLDSLSRQPALLREVTAELGKLRPDLFGLALDVLGLQVPAHGSANQIGAALSSWDMSLRGDGNDPSELARRAGYQGESSPSGWEEFLEDFSESELSSRLASWRGEMKPDAAVDAAVVDLYRSSVEESLAPPEPSEEE